MARNRKKDADLISVSEAAKRLKVTRQAVHQAIQRGRLPVQTMTIMVPRRVRGIPREAVEEYAEKPAALAS